MKTQLIQGHNGLPIGVFIPIEDWELIKKSYPSIEHIADDMPEWQKDINDERLRNKLSNETKKMLDDRLKVYEENPHEVYDFDQLIDELNREI